MSVPAVEMSSSAEGIHQRSSGVAAAGAGADEASVLEEYETGKLGCCKRFQSAVLMQTLGPEVGKSGRVVLRLSRTATCMAFLTALLCIALGAFAYIDARNTDVATFGVGKRDSTRDCIGTPGFGQNVATVWVPCYPAQALRLTDPLTSEWHDSGFVHEVVRQDQPPITHYNGVEVSEGGERFIWFQPDPAPDLETAAIVPKGGALLVAATVDAVFMTTSDTGDEDDLPVADSGGLQQLVAEWAGLTFTPSSVSATAFTRAFPGTFSTSFQFCTNFNEPGRPPLDGCGSGFSSPAPFNVTFANGVTVDKSELVCLAGGPFARELVFGRSDFVCFESSPRSMPASLAEAFTAAIGLLGALSLLFNGMLCRKSV